MGSCAFEVADASQESPAPRLERDMVVGARGVERGGSSAGGVEVISEEGARMAWDCLVGGPVPRKGGVGLFVVTKREGCSQEPRTVTRTLSEG